MSGRRRFGVIRPRSLVMGRALKDVGGSGPVAERGRFAPGVARAALVVAAVLVGIGSEASGADYPEARKKFHHGDYEGALADATAAIEAREFGEEWPILELNAALALGRHEEAEPRLLRALERYPSSIRLRVAALPLCRVLGREDRRKKLLEEITDLDRQMSWRYTDSLNRVALGEARLAAGADAREVLDAYFDRALRDRPDSFEAHRATGRLALEKNDFALAAESLEKARRAMPDDPEVLLGLAIARGESGQSEAAEELMARLVEQNPRYAPALLHLAERRADEEQYGAARALIAQAQAVNPRDARALALVAALDGLEGRWDDAKRRRDEALAQGGADPALDHLIGRHWSRHYRFAEGEAAQARALKIDPGYAPALIQRAEDLLRLGREEEGWRQVAAAYARDPYHVTAFNLVELQGVLERYTVLTRPRFLVRMEPREARVYGPAVVRLVERALDVLAAKYEVEFERPLVIEIFAQQKDFAVRTFGVPGGSGFLGVCFGPVITAPSPALRRDSTANWEAVLWHELCHAVTLQKSRNRMPRWLSEGISVYEERQADAGWGRPMTPADRERILAGRFQPLSQLSAAFLEAKEPADLQFAYFEAGQAVEFLVGRYEVRGLRRMLDQLGEDRPLLQVLEQTAGPLPALDDEFAVYLRARAEQFSTGAEWAAVPIAGDAGSETWEAFVRANPHHARGLQGLARSLLLEKQWAAATEAADRFRKLAPDYVGPDSAWELLAAAARGAGDRAAERAALAEWSRRDGDSLVAQRAQALSALADEDWAGLQAAAGRLLGVDPFQAEGWRLRAEAAEALEEQAAAVEARRTLLELNPVDPAEARYLLARALKAAGDANGARRAALEAIEEAPRYRAALQLLLELGPSPATAAAPGEPGRVPEGRPAAAATPPVPVAESSVPPAESPKPAAGPGATEPRPKEMP